MGFDDNLCPSFRMFFLSFFDRCSIPTYYSRSVILMLHTGRSAGLKDCYFKTHLQAERKGSLEDKALFFFFEYCCSQVGKLNSHGSLRNYSYAHACSVIGNINLCFRCLRSLIDHNTTSSNKLN